MAGLTCTSLAADEQTIRRSLPAVVEDARVLGANYIVLAWINHETPFGVGDCQRVIGDFNRWGEQFRAAGLQFCYHAHGFEFGPGPAGTLFDTMVDRTRPEFVDYEMDAYWFVWPGQDPVRYLRRYPGRFRLMHLKDLRKGVRRNPDGNPPAEYSGAIGAGSLDFPAILLAARKAGVKRYYIEDESPLAPAQVPPSFRYLKSIRL